MAIRDKRLMSYVIKITMTEPVRPSNLHYLDDRNYLDFFSTGQGSNNKKSTLLHFIFYLVLNV